MLEVKNLHARAGDAAILKGVDLRIAAGEVHAVMGPNGSGKSTLANVLVGRPSVEITQGEVLFEGRDLTALAPEERARCRRRGSGTGRSPPEMGSDPPTAPPV